MNYRKNVWLSVSMYLLSNINRRSEYKRQIHIWTLFLTSILKIFLQCLKLKYFLLKIWYIYNISQHTPNEIKYFKCISYSSVLKPLNRLNSDSYIKQVSGGRLHRLAFSYVDTKDFRRSGIYFQIASSYIIRNKVQNCIAKNKDVNLC